MGGHNAKFSQHPWMAALIKQSFLRKQRLAKFSKSCIHQDVLVKYANEGQKKESENNLKRKEMFKILVDTVG